MRQPIGCYRLSGRSPAGPRQKCLTSRNLGKVIDFQVVSMTFWNGPRKIEESIECCCLPAMSGALLEQFGAVLC